MMCVRVFSNDYPLRWDLDSYKQIIDSAQTIEAPLLDQYLNNAGAYEPFLLDDKNSIYVQPVTLGTVNSFPLDLLPMTVADLSSDTLWPLRDMKKQFRVDHNAQVIAYLIYKDSINITQVNIALPCICNNQQHDEFARCLRTSAMYTYITGAVSLLINSFSRNDMPKGVLCPTNGAADVLHATNILRQHYSDISALGTSWGGIGTWLASSDFIQKAMGMSEETSPSKFYTIGAIPIFRFKGDRHNGRVINIHGSNDYICEYHTAVSIMRKSNATVITVPRQGHNFHMFDTGEGFKKAMGCVPFEKVTMSVVNNQNDATDIAKTDMNEILSTGLYSEKRVTLDDGNQEMTWIEFMDYFAQANKNQNIPYGHTISSYDTTEKVIKAFLESSGYIYVCK